MPAIGSRMPPMSTAAVADAADTSLDGNTIRSKSPGLSTNPPHQSGIKPDSRKRLFNVKSSEVSPYLIHTTSPRIKWKLEPDSCSDLLKDFA